MLGLRVGSGVVWGCWVKTLPLEQTQGLGRGTGPSLLPGATLCLPKEVAPTALDSGGPPLMQTQGTQPSWKHKFWPP